MDEVGHVFVQLSALVLFLAVFAEQIGLPLPSMPVLIAAGALVGTGKMTPAVALGVAVMAALAGDLVWYRLGRSRGHQVLALLCRLALEPDSCVRRTERVFALHGVRSLVVAKFIPWLGTVMPVLAGICGMSLTRFVLYDGFGSVIWVGFFETLGYLGSDHIERLAASSTWGGLGLTVILVGLVVAWILHKAVVRQRLLRRLQVVARISATELQDKLARGEEIVILDVRHALDLAAVPDIVPGALCIPAEEMESRHVELPRDRELVVYCACPHEVTSARVALQLNEKGFSNTRALAGGIHAWCEHRHRNTKAATTTGLTDGAEPSLLRQ
jgi:membrane protein DedA with SNARE-associated domain/rhodanese-related sulfurtransferase